MVHRGQNLCSDCSAQFVEHTIILENRSVFYVQYILLFSKLLARSCSISHMASKYMAEGFILTSNWDEIPLCAIYYEQQWKITM